MGDKLLRNWGIIFSASAVSFFFAYIFQLYIARALGPENAPEAIIGVLFGKSYSSISRYLVWYASAMGLLSLATVFMFYNASAKRTAFRYPLILFTILEIVLLILFQKHRWG